MNFFVNFNEIFIDKRIVSGKMKLRVELMNNFKGRLILKRTRTVAAE